MSSREESAEGEAWDGSTWVDVGPDGRWHPSVAERTRAFVLLGVMLGFLLLAAAIASIGGDDEPSVAEATSTTTTSEVATTTTQPLPSSIDGEPPPDACLDDDRMSLPLRDTGEITVSVLNGARVTGLAGRTGGELEALGYISVPGDAPETETTAVTHIAGYCAEAVRVAEALGVPDAPVAVGEPASGGQLEVVLGADEFLDG